MNEDVDPNYFCEHATFLTIQHQLFFPEITPTTSKDKRFFLKGVK